MHLKLLRAAAAVAVLGGTATLGLGTQAAMATTTTVDCNTADLVTAMTYPNYASGDTLVLAPHCTYWLTGSTGLPTIMHTLTIVGHDSTWVKRSYDNTNSFSIFAVGCANGNLTLDDVNVANGGGPDQSDGGAVYMNPGTLTVNGGIFHDNNTTDYGGAIYNYNGTLTVNHAIFTDNSSGDGGAISSYNNTSTAALNHVVFSRNSAVYGGAIYNNDNNMTISDSSFNYNTATGDGAEGGAIFNDYYVAITHSGFLMNTAIGEGAQGGAIYNNDETVIINRSLITVNRAEDGGGGIYNYDGGTVTLHWNLINGNVPDNCEPVGTITGCVG
jgi:predicted outer membrane repeat protein